MHAEMINTKTGAIIRINLVLRDFILTGANVKVWHAPLDARM